MGTWKGKGFREAGQDMRAKCRIDDEKKIRDQAKERLADFVDLNTVYSNVLPTPEDTDYFVHSLLVLNRDLRCLAMGRMGRR